MLGYHCNEGAGVTGLNYALPGGAFDMAHNCSYVPSTVCLEPESSNPGVLCFIG